MRIGTVTTSGVLTDQTTPSFSHTNDVTANKLYVIVEERNASADNITAITYNSVALTAVSDASNGNYRIRTFYLDSPATGANTLAVTFAGNVDAVFITAIACIDAATGAPVASNTATGTGTTASVAVTPTVNGAFVFGSVNRDFDSSGDSFTPGNTMTARSAVGSPTQICVNNRTFDHVTGGTARTATWTLNDSAAWVAVADAINPSVATWALDAISFKNREDGATSPEVWSHTCSGSDRILIVGTQYYVGSGGGGNVVITDVTYAGVSMTALATYTPQSSAGGGSIGLYYLVAPSTGANNISVSWTGSNSYLGGTASSYVSIGQSPTIHASGADTFEVSTTATVSLTSMTIGDLIVGIGGGGGGSADLGAGTSNAVTIAQQSMGYLYAVASSDTIDFSTTNDWISAIGVAFAQAVASGPATLKVKKGVAVASVKTMKGLTIATTKTAKGLA